jgi:hypothetical protein
MNRQGNNEADGIKNFLFPGFKKRQPRNSIPDQHYSHPAPHKSGQKNKDPFINRRCKFSPVHSPSVMFGKPEWFNINSFPYLPDDIGFFFKHFIECLTIGEFVNNN